MEDFYELLYQDYKKYLIDNSTYKTEVYKTSPQKPSSFPVIEMRMLDDRIDNNNCTIDNLEYYYNVSLIITIYTQNIGETDKSIIANELSKLTNKYFIKKGLLKSGQNNEPNIDKTILRRIITYDCKVGNKNYNIRKI